MENLVGYVLINFATPIVFFITFHAWGSKPAIGFSIGVTCIQLLAHAIYRIKPSPFFILASGFTVAFGTIDLFLANPRYFRLEPFVQNFIMATLFLCALIFRVPVMRYLLEALPKKIKPDLGYLGAPYLRRLTWLCVIYLYLKSAFFLYLAFHVNLANLIVLRTIFGGGTLVLLFLGEMLYRKWRKTAKVR